MQLQSKKTITKTITKYRLHPEIDAYLEITEESSSRSKKENRKLVCAEYLGESPIKGAYPMLVKPEFFELIKRLNPWVTVRGKFGWDGMGVDAEDLAKSVLLDPTVTIDPDHFIWSYGAGHLIFDRHGDPIPVPYCFDYISSPFENQHCDLKPMLAHLKQHPWVVNRDELSIQDVPYYNNESGDRQFIAGKEMPWVSVLPDKAALKEIYQRALEKDREYFSVRMKDLLLSDAVYNWPTTKEKDWMEIRQFYKPSRDEEYYSH